MAPITTSTAPPPRLTPPGGYTIVKAYVREKKLGGQEMFVPLAHPPGDAQADFGEALVVIDGVERKAHYLVVDLPHSDDTFVDGFDGPVDSRSESGDRRPCLKVASRPAGAGASVRSRGSFGFCRRRRVLST